MHPVTDDPLAWQGRLPRLPVHPPGAGVFYAWHALELPPVANDAMCSAHDAHHAHQAADGCTISGTVMPE